MSSFPSLKRTAYFNMTENNSGQDEDTSSVMVSHQTIRKVDDVTLVFSFQIPSYQHKRLSNETMVSFFLTCWINCVLNLLSEQAEITTLLQMCQYTCECMCMWVEVVGDKTGATIDTAHSTCADKYTCKCKIEHTHIQQLFLPFLKGL